MNLLAYTKQLSEKIKLYDRLYQNIFSGINMTNPFAKPVNVTIIWVEKSDEN